MIRTICLLLLIAMSAGATAQTTATAPAAPEDAPCAARLQQISLPDARYAPYSPGDTSIPLSISVADVRNCRLSLTFRSLGANRMTYADASVRYRLRDDGGREIPADGVASRFVPSSGTAGVNVLMAIVLPAGQTVRPGIYRDQLHVQLLDGDRMIDARDLAPGATVISQANIAAAGSAVNGFSSALGAQMDFGRLEAGKEREAFLFVQSNTTYALELRSENRGVMRRDGGTTASDEIAYRASLDGQPLDLTRPVVVSGRTGAQVQAPYSLRARIANVDGKVAGKYRDVITVNVIILE